MKKTTTSFQAFAVLSLGFLFSQGSALAREPASFEFAVLAVSQEDAMERAAEMLRDGSLKEAVAWERVVSATLPRCEERGSAFECETRLTYSNEIGVGRSSKPTHLSRI